MTPVLKTVTYTLLESEFVNLFGGVTLYLFDEHIYLGENKRRITIGWKAFGMNKDISKSTMSMCLKHKIYNGCIIPAVIYSCETWKLTKQSENQLRIAQRAMERAMLGMTLRDRK